MSREFTDAEKDRLGEVMNIGANTASTALSRMVGKRVNMGVPEAFVGSPDKAPRFFGPTESLVTAVLLKVLGDLQGLMMVLFPPASAADLAGLLRKQERRGETLDDMDRSALKEAGNILIGASLSAFSRFMDLRLLQSVPDAATDMLGSVVDGLIAELGRSADRVLVFRIDLAVEGEAIEGTILFLFDPAATETILDAAEKKIGRS